MKPTIEIEARTIPRPARLAGGWMRVAIVAAAILAGALVVRQAGLFEQLGPGRIAGNVDALRLWFDGFGLLAPLVFIAAWVVAAVFFVPGLPLTILGAVVFGAAWGTVYTSIGATLGATAAFLVGRHGARGMVEGLLEKSPMLRRIDDGVRRQGWIMLMITRLVPLFPFNAQNYVYGLTTVSLPTYMLVSWLAMIPGTLACNLLADSVLAGDLGVAARRALGAGTILLVLALLSARLGRRLLGGSAKGTAAVQ